jgi:DNA-binding MarR family transcriptional regulator
VPQRIDLPSDTVVPFSGSTASEDIEQIYLDKLLCHRITALSKLMNRRAGRYLAREFNLTIAEWWMLGQLDEYSPRTLRWLAEATFTDKAQMSRAAAALVERGLVQRKTDPADARSVLFSITTDGKGVSAASFAARRAANQALLSLLSDEERNALYSSLDTLTARLLIDSEAGV